MNLPDDFPMEPGGHIGVSGSRYKATPEALDSLRFLIDQCAALGARYLHQGCCTGWDEGSIVYAHKAGLIVVGHPPIKTEFLSKKACEESDTLWEPKTYHARDMDIAFESSVLLIGPRYPENHARSRHSGTWLTVGFARRYGDRVYACDTNGDISDVTEAA